MKINEQQLRKLGDLARLHISEEEMIKMYPEFNKMIDFIEQLDNLDTDNVSPLIHIHQYANTYRKDIVIQKELKKPILNQATNKNSDYFKVPKVLQNKK
tara:strand:- start:121 stop:417 length:297 start_codon:yes stop_codon:yes gene_type:complete